MQPRSRILVVDDNPTNIKIAKVVLGETYHLATAVTGEEALQIAPEFRPDIILLDIMMPGIDGYEVCRQIRDNPALRHTKIIMVSAKAMVSERLEGYEAGADDYLTKPFEEEELLAKVRVYMRLKSVEELDQLKSNVLSLLGHETRTPLGAIITPAEMLAADEEIDAEERNMLAEMICRNARRLHAFFEKVMTLSAMKAGNVGFRFEEGNPCEVVRDAVAEMASQAAAREVTIEQDLPEMPIATIDRQQIQCALTTILDNAVRFSPPGGQVTVRVRNEDDHILMNVTDCGEGIDPHFLPHVLDDFTSADIEHHTEGQGLSLAIANQIVLAHSGTISVESIKDKETTFTVRLPAAREAGEGSPTTCVACAADAAPSKPSGTYPG
jgi:signal transduction histidine kinase